MLDDFPLLFDAFAFGLPVVLEAAIRVAASSSAALLEVFDEVVLIELVADAGFVAFVAEVALVALVAETGFAELDEEAAGFAVACLSSAA